MMQMIETSVAPRFNFHSAWVFAIVVLATTIFPFVITAAGTVPILMQWARRDVKRHFGRPA